MESRLYEAAIRGSVTMLLELLKEDGNILDRALHDCVGKDNPLHIGALFGHVDFVRETAKGKPEFARGLNSQGLSPLHFASEKGHIQVVKELLKTDLDVCFVRDRDGRTPLHTAAMKGRLGVLKEMVCAKAIAAWVFTDQREPILHLCANHNQFEALKMLVELVDDTDFVNLKDNEDNTILHLLTTKEQHEVIKFLIDKYAELDVNAINVHGCTTLDISIENSGGSDQCKIARMLRDVGAQTGSDSSLTPPSGLEKSPPKEELDNNNKTKETLMVVAVLMATVTFGAGLSPPGGFWDKEGFHNETSSNIPVYHYAGQPIMPYYHPHTYIKFVIFNTIGFLASLALILLLVSGFSFKRRLSMWTLTAITWIAVTSMLVTYGSSFHFLDRHFKVHWLTVPMSIAGWLVLMGIIIAAHFVRMVHLLHVLGIMHLYRFVLVLLRKVGLLKRRSVTHSSGHCSRVVELEP